MRRTTFIILIKLSLVIIIIIGIPIVAAQTVRATTTYDPQAVMEPGGYNENEKYVIKKDIAAPTPRHTDRQGTDTKDEAMREYTKDYPYIPAPYIPLIYESCVKSPKCDLTATFTKLNNQWAPKKPVSWYKSLWTAFSDAFWNPLARWSSTTSKKSMQKTSSIFSFLSDSLGDFFKNMLSWNWKSSTSQYVADHVIAPTVALAKAAGEKSLEFAQILAKSATELGALLTKPDPAALAATDPQGYGSHVNYFNKFVYGAHDSRIPLAYQEVYGWAPEWNPAKYPQDM